MRLRSGRDVGIEPERHDLIRNSATSYGQCCLSLHLMIDVTKSDTSHRQLIWLLEKTADLTTLKTLLATDASAPVRSINSPIAIVILSVRLSVRLSVMLLSCA